MEPRFIGRIELMDEYSLVELPAHMPEEVRRHLRDVEVCGQPLRIRKARPDEAKPPRTQRFPERGRGPQRGRAPRSFTGRRAGGGGGGGGKFRGRKSGGGGGFSGTFQGNSSGSGGPGKFVKGGKFKKKKRKGPPKGE